MGLVRFLIEYIDKYIGKYQLINRVQSADDDDDELFLWYGWPMKDV